MALQTPHTALKRSIVLVLMAGLFPILSWGQANLVPNPSFEEYDHCSSSGQGLGWADHWSVPETGYTPDYFHRCSLLSSKAVPENTRGIQEPVSGDGYVGFEFLEPPVENFREAIGCHLLAALVEGETYVFKMYVSLSDYSSYRISTVGYKLSQSPLLGPTPIVEYEATYSSDTPLEDKENWRVITDTVIAQGGEQYLTIANFMSDAMSDSVYVGNGTNGDRAYYYIDDVSLVPLDSLLAVENQETIEVDLYPNPASDYIALQSKEPLKAAWLSDISGRRLWPLERRTSSYWETDISGLPSGIYLIEATADDGRKAVRKVVKL
jgi:hypothetical protein